ncbi:MAG: SufD family Fe-S cluster assembly protein [Nitrososphaerota archaeon]
MMFLDKEEIEKALNKPAAYGPDVDISQYGMESFGQSNLDETIVRESYNVGVDLSRRDQLNTYLQIDHDVVFKTIQKKFEEDIELMSLTEALEKYEWVRDIYWKLKSPYEDKYTAFVAKNEKSGYFLRILEGRKIHLPIQACFFMYSPSLVQSIHNIIVAEEGSEANVITGCTNYSKIASGLHIGVTEIYVKNNAKLNYTMIHRWGRGLHVRPRTGIILENGAKLLYNYVVIGEVGSLQSYPHAIVEGKNARLSMNNILYVVGESNMDLGGEVNVKDAGSGIELVTNAVASGRTKLMNRGAIISEAPKVKGHISCRALMLSNEAEVSAIPVLVSRNMESELTHEAAIGKIAEEQLFYLRARGLRREEAESILIRGFLDISMMELPKHIEKTVEKVIELAMKGF